MSKITALVDQLQDCGGGARDLTRALVAQYEDELGQITGHLGQMYEELMLLYGIGDDVAATLDPTAIADTAIGRIIGLLDAAGGVVLLSDPFSPDPAVVGTRAVPAGAQSLLHWATAQAIEKDRAIILNDLTSGENPRCEHLQALLTCPLRARGRVTGALHLFDKQVAGGFTTEDQMLLQAVATQLGSALENARLFEAEQRHANHLSDALDELQSTYDDTLAALSGALDLRDNETEGHARRVTRYSVRIAQSLGIAGRELIDIERGALLHDIGKIGVPDSILLKPAKLTEEEWVVMRTHPTLGWNMVRSIRFLSGASPIVLHHHERFDGGGYPANLMGEGIPMGARVFAVADTYDAMTSDRPYRKALSYDVTVEEIERCRGSQFDPAVVDAFRAVPEDQWDAIRDHVDTELANKRRDPRLDS